MQTKDDSIRTLLSKIYNIEDVDKQNEFLIPLLYLCFLNEDEKRIVDFLYLQTKKVTLRTISENLSIPIMTLYKKLERLNGNYGFLIVIRQNLNLFLSHSFRKNLSKFYANA